MVHYFQVLSQYVRGKSRNRICCLLCSHLNSCMGCIASSWLHFTIQWV